MKLKKSSKLVLYLVAVCSVFALGGWAYNEVAVKNRPLSPDEIEANASTGLTQNDNKTALKEFNSQGNLLYFTYPQEWNQENLGPAELGENVIATSTITNYEQNNTVSGGFPENGVRIEVVISNITVKDANKPIIECGMKTTSCEPVELNGHTFQKSEATLNTGFITKSIGTITGNKRVMLTFLIGTGPQQQPNSTTVDKIISSVKIQP